MINMRIIVISDTHRQQIDLIHSLIDLQKPDVILHLGDNVEDGENLSKIFGIETIIVKGNGDFNSDYPYDRILDLAGKRIFMTHGHRYNVKNSYMSLYYKGLEVKADMVLYGHTHVPLNVNEKGMIIMNPGSPSLPRQMERIKTIGLIEINKEITTEIIKIT